MTRILTLAVLILMAPVLAHAATYYAALTGNDAGACSTAQDIATPKRTIASAVACLAAGDTLYIRGGTWTERIDLQSPVSKTGTSTAWITISGYPGETVILRYTDTLVQGYGAVRARGNRGYFIFQDFEIDGVNFAHDAGWQIRDGNHHFILRRLKIYNQDHSGIYVDASDILLEENDIHDLRSDCAVGNRHHALYLHDGSNLVARRNKLWNTPGGGIQLYPGPWTNAKLQDNLIHHTNFCSTSNTGGIVVGSDNNGQVGSIIDAEVTGNIIAYTNRKTDGTGNGTAMGLRVYNNYTLDHQVSGTKVHNNTIYKVYNYTSDPLVGTEYCMNIAAGAVNTDVRNNYMSDCAGGASGGTLAYNNSGTGTTASHNSCTASENCPATNKVSVAAPTDVFVDPANLDFRLKQGTNALRNAGTTVTTRPSPIGTTDIGAYEQGQLESAVVVDKFIEVTAGIMTAPLQPTSGVTGLTVTCIGCTGTPVVSQAILKAGAAAILQLSISGISSPGTCSLSLGSTNLTDSGTIGNPVSESAQGLNSVTGLSVSGTCENTVAGGGAPTPTHSRFPLDEGSGTVATDNTGNGNHGTVSSGVTWVSNSSGTGVTFPADTTYRQITTTFGAGVDPTTTSFAQCVDVEPDLSAVPSIMMSAGSNGTNQRAYVGIYNVGGQPQWGIGVQSSGFTTGSEFVATAQRAIVCITFDSVTDTATLWVDGVKGVQSGKSVKTYTSYGLVGNLRVGNDGTFTTNNGGFTVYGVWTWNTLPSDADLIAIYDAEFPSGTPLACHEQKTHKWELTRTDASGTPIATGTTGGSVDVVDGGGVALVIQIDCTTVAGAPLALRFYYSSDGVAYDFEIPTSLGAGGIALWGTDVSSGLNDGNATCCITGALTPVTGPTITRINSTPIINLAQNQSWTVRVLLRFATGLVGQSRYILLKQDNGLDLANGYTVGGARVNIISNRAGTGF